MNLRRLVVRWVTLLLCAALAAAWACNAQAAHLSGGKSAAHPSASIGVVQHPGVPGRAAPASGLADGAATSAARPRGGLLGELTAGLGLTWLARALGLGPAFGNVLLVFLLVLVMLALGTLGMLHRSRALTLASGGPRAYWGAGAGNPVTPRQYNPIHVGNDASARPWESTVPLGAGGAAFSGPQERGIPAEFDVAGFLAAAKRNFVTLQNAWDRSDIPTLRAMMTDDMLAQIQSQLAERERAAAPGQINQTDVVMLQAQLLGIEQQDGAQLASVEFSGLIREEPSAGPSPFREVWNMTKPQSGSGGWLVAGVQALQ